MPIQAEILIPLLSRSFQRNFPAAAGDFPMTPEEFKVADGGSRTNMSEDTVRRSATHAAAGATRDHGMNEGNARGALTSLSKIE
jgi:hypothetical protein